MGRIPKILSLGAPKNHSMCYGDSVTLFLSRFADTNGLGGTPYPPRKVRKMYHPLFLQVVIICVWIPLLQGGLALSQASEEPEPEAPSLCQPSGFPSWTFDESHLFPPDRPLARPEDGKALPDGGLVVADERHGLLLLEQNGTHRPFGNLQKSGYIHNPPDIEGGAHGIFLEDNGSHLLLSDVYSGKIYRVNTATEETRLLYEHPYGVNSLYRDRQGTIWFTQSARNTAEGGRNSLWDSVNKPEPTGAVFTLKVSGDGSSVEAKEVVTGLYFANGIIFDQTEEVYVCRRDDHGSRASFPVWMSKARTLSWIVSPTFRMFSCPTISPLTEKTTCGLCRTWAIVPS